MCCSLLSSYISDSFYAFKTWIKTQGQLTKLHIHLRYREGLIVHVSAKESSCQSSVSWLKVGPITWNITLTYERWQRPDSENSSWLWATKGEMSNLYVQRWKAARLEIQVWYPKIGKPHMFMVQLFLLLLLFIKQFAFQWPYLTPEFKLINKTEFMHLARMRFSFCSPSLWFRLKKHEFFI